jgi:hypothetical protein
VRLSLATLLVSTVTDAQGGGSAVAENRIWAMRLKQFALQGTHASYLMEP